MAIYTLASRVSRALDFYNESSIYWALGGQSPWPNSNASGEVPDTPNINDTINDIFVYKRNTLKSLVRPWVEGDTGDFIEYRGSKWKLIDETDAYSEGARWVYLRTDLAYAEVSTVLTYRKLGIFTGSQPLVTTDVVEPSDMSDPGVLEVLDYRKPIYRSTDQQETLNIILEF